MRTFFHRYILVVFVGCLYLVLAGPAAAAVDDGFGPSQKSESRYFSISYSPKINPISLVQRLGFTPSTEFLTRQGIAGDLSFQDFPGVLDALFLRVSGILDMNLYSFKGNIKVCRTQDDLKRIYYNLFRRNNVPDTGYSFYVYELNTIYISEDYFTKAVLGHEMAHAVISNYFVVQPSVKVQEVLAGYIEFQLRK